MLPFFIITGAFLVIGAVLIGSGILPEEKAEEFRSLTDVSITNDMKVIKEPTLEDNTLTYARLMMWHSAGLTLLKVIGG